MHRSKGKLSGVLHKGFKPDKCKTALRMALARIKLLRNRKEVQVRQMRREVAQLLDANQDQTARIRVEHVIREEKFMQAYDLIEVYCELIVARLSIIDSQTTCPIDLKEAIASVIFASMRCSDVTELVDVRKHFTSKYGKEFVAAALEVRPDSGVIEKLSGGAPDTQMKIKTLTSIAEEHNIKWEPKAFEETLQKQNEDLLHGTTYSGGNIPNSVMPTSQTSVPSYSYVESPNSRVPTAHSYSSAEVPDNRISYVAANPNAYSRENRGGSEYSVPPSSQHGALAYSSAQIPGPNSFSDENTGGPNVCRPYSQYGTTVPDTTSRSEELPWERKSSASGSNWNVEFRDATSAAQAAAESAEMASFAARAAAQLASRGNFSAEQNTEPFESAAYTHETTPRKQQAEHLMKDGQRSFSEQSSGANDPMFISSNARKDREREETNCVGSVNMSGPLSSAQFHSYSPDIHEYGMPTEPDRAHSPEHPYSDDSSEKESNSGRPEDHAFNFPGERLFDARLDGRNIEDTESKHASFDLENTDNYHRNYTSSHGTFTHGSSTVWDNQNDKTGADSSAVVFDQYDSVVGEKNLLDCFSSKHTEEPAIQDHMGFSNADWSQQHRSTSPVNHSTYTLFSRTETHPSYNLEVNRKDIPSHSYDNVAPTFDSVGVSSDEEVTTVMHAKPLRSHSRGSDFCESKEEIISGKVVRDFFLK
ncbi:hypothetical protein GUJ93_ZPchr0001g31333 [Zizania palustris]|uniref:IST1-like protein n=1 Tax=Zizania palustris TaxID=103762 RepID=A0A8J5S098_ZIZPA|nr:hypothetical protein GUJ93_ZPchr0001g31333 [Zizania palustris]